MNKTLVISRYKENLDWLNDINNDISVIVYNKAPFQLELDKKYKVINCENIGREAHTYIRYIVDNYYNLNELTYFAQGNPFDHVNDFINFVNLSNTQLWASDWVTACSLWGFPHHVGLDIKGFADLINIEIPNKIIKFKTGAIFSVSKENILKRDIMFYKNVLKVILDFWSKKHNKSLPTGITATAWILERLWGLIFNLE